MVVGIGQFRPKRLVKCCCGVGHCSSIARKPCPCLSALASLAKLRKGSRTALGFSASFRTIASMAETMQSEMSAEDLCSAAGRDADGLLRSIRCGALSVLALLVSNYAESPKARDRRVFPRLWRIPYCISHPSTACSRDHQRGAGPAVLEDRHSD